ncbi:MAG: chromate resistance protein ChrB domain-containing protein [Beijerinckiaceae bacterium]
MGVPYSISANNLLRGIGSPNAPLVIDVSREERIAERGVLIPGSLVRSAFDAERWASDLPGDREIVLTCVHGHERSQYAAAVLRARGLRASILDQGFDGWNAAAGPTVRREAGPVRLGDAPTRWVTRRRPKIDRVACPWLIRRFLDPQATVLFAETADVAEVAAQSGATGFDYPGAPFEHDGELCSFEVMLRAFGLESHPDLQRLALIVRAADTDRLDLAQQAAGLLAISLGLSAQCGDDDHAMLRHGMVLYDGLWHWIRHASAEIHNWPRAQ